MLNVSEKRNETYRISSCIFCIYVIKCSLIKDFIIFHMLPPTDQNNRNKNIFVYALRFILLNTLCYITFQPTFNPMLDLAILLEYASPLCFQDGGHKYLRVVIFFDQTYYTKPKQ